MSVLFFKWEKMGSVGKNGVGLMFVDFSGVSSAVFWGRSRCRAVRRKIEVPDRLTDLFHLLLFPSKKLPKHQPPTLRSNTCATGASFTPPLDEDKLRRQGTRCMDCGIPFCHTGKLINGMAAGCSLHNLIPAFKFPIQWLTSDVQ